MLGRTLKAPATRRGAHSRAFKGQSRSTRLHVYAVDRVPVRFRVIRKVAYGEKVKIVGNRRELGQWNTEEALELEWNQGDVWSVVVPMPVGKPIEFKCVTTGEDAGWEDGGNREFTIWGPDYSLDIRCRWGLTDDTEIQAAALPRNGQADFPTLASLRAADLAAEEAAELLRAKLKDKKKALAGSATNGSKPSPAAATPAAAVAEDNGQSRDEAREQRDREKEAERRERKEREAREREQQREQTEAQRVLAAAAAASNGSSSNGSSSSPESTLSDEDAPGRAWQGRQIRFMRSNEHTKERSGKWDTHGLHGPKLWLVEGDRGAPNWLGKLGVAKQVLVDRADRARPDVGALAAAYVYLQWITTGAIPCVEGGGHYRPNHHARLAQDIFRWEGTRGGGGRGPGAGAGAGAGAGGLIGLQQQEQQKKQV